MKIENFKNETKTKQHFNKKPFDKKPKKMTKKEIKKAFYDLIETLWKKPKVDIFNVQSYAWDWIEHLLADQKEDIKEKIRKVGMEERWAMQAFHNGYDQAKIDILKKLNK